MHWDRYLNEDKAKLTLFSISTKLTFNFLEMRNLTIRQIKTMFKLEGLLAMKGSLYGHT